MEIEKQRIRVGSQHLSMLDMVSDLTGLVREYRKVRRPLAERRKDLHTAWALGERIVWLASQRPWRQYALQHVLRALEIQDGGMYQRVTEVLARAKEKSKDDEPVEEKLPSPIELSMSNLIKAEDKIGISFGIRNSKETVDSEQVLVYFEQTQREGNTILDLIHDSHPDYIDNDAILDRELKLLRRNDPEMYQRVARTLNDLQDARIRNKKKKIPQPRAPRKFEIYRSDESLVRRH